MTISKSTADHMMGIIVFSAIQCAIENDHDLDLDATEKFAREMFIRYCEMEGITEVDDK